tara:strand:- start:67 stop:261 length:195 start_codon:yes stop_codon:yes gene_type:complete
MIINTEHFQLKSLTTKYVTEKYLSWFSESDGNENNAHAVYVYKKMKFRVIEDNDNEIKMRLNLE